MLGEAQTIEGVIRSSKLKVSPEMTWDAFLDTPLVVRLRHEQISDAPRGFVRIILLLANGEEYRILEKSEYRRVGTPLRLKNLLFQKVEAEYKVGRGWHNHSEEHAKAAIKGQLTKRGY